MKNLQLKTLCLKKLGWKRVAKNQMRFGWDLYDGEEETTTTTTTTYETTFYEDKAYTEEHKDVHSKTRIWLYFQRHRDNYQNLLAILPLEIIYNICFYVRRIIGFFLIPAFVIIIIASTVTSGSVMTEEESNIVSLWYSIAFFSWLILIAAENILSRIAGKILKPKN